MPSSTASVHGIYTDQRGTDAPGCNLAQPNFADELAHHNVIFRIPTPIFGLGLVEATTDSTLEANLGANGNAERALGVVAAPLNTNGNDGTTTPVSDRKPRTESLVIFAGAGLQRRAGRLERGLPQERAAVPGCTFNPQPEDPLSNNAGASDVVNFANFMRLSAPPTPGPTSAAAADRGSALFDSVGCGNCHSRSLTTGPATRISAFANVTYHPFSDFAVHHIGVRRSPTAFIRAAPAPTNSERLRSGASGSGCSSSTTAARRTSAEQSNSTPARDAGA